MPTTTTRPLKVGELARNTGLSVRTLHHYDGIGLLVPSLRTPAGHRLYAQADIERLQQIQSLKSIGFSLDEIGHLLSGRAYSAQRVIELHLSGIESQIEAMTRLAGRLQEMSRFLEDGKAVPVEELCRIIEGTVMMEKYFTPEQMKEIRARGEALGADKIRQAEEAWAEVIPAVRRHMAQGTSPDNPELQELAKKWRELVNAFTGGNREIAAGLRSMYNAEHARINAENPNTPDPAMFAFMKQVFDRIGGGPG